MSCSVRPIRAIVALLAATAFAPAVAARADVRSLPAPALGVGLLPGAVHAVDDVADEAPGASIGVAPLRSGPVLTPDGVAWAEADGAGYVVRSSSGARIVVPGEQGVAIAPELHASADLLAVGEGRVAFGGDGYVAPASQPSDARSWAPDGTPLARLGPCHVPPTVGGTLGLVGLAGHDVALCDAAGRSVSIADGRTGQGLQQIPAAASIVGVRLTASFAAWLEEVSSDVRVFTLVVFDRVAGREVLRVRTTQLGGALYDWDLGADGTVVYAVGDPIGSPGRRQRIGWTSPAAPGPHALGVRPSYWYTVRAAPGVAAFQRASASGTRQVGVAPLDGAPARVLADGVVGGFDVDASRVAFAHPGCEDETIDVRPLTAPAFVAPAPAHCVLPLRAPARQAASTVAVSVACRRLPFACEGPAELTLPRRGGRSLLLARGTLNAGAVTLHLRRAARRLLRERHTVIARLSVAFAPVDPAHPIVYRRSVGLR